MRVLSPQTLQSQRVREPARATSPDSLAISSAEIPSRLDTTPVAEQFKWRKVRQFGCMRLADRVVACALLAFVTVSCQVRQEPGSAEQSKEELPKLENRWLAVERDPNALEDILAPDFLHVVSAGIITKEEQLKFLRQHPAPKQRSEKHFEDLRVRVYGEVGVVNGAVIETADGTKHKTLFTDVFAYRHGKWQAVNAQELPVAIP
jgi:hypothetical protein